MFRHLIKIAFRNFIRYKSFAFINIFGLSIGLTTFILIALFVQFELSWDKFNEKHDRIYRLQVTAHMANGDDYYSQIGYPVGGALASMYPEIEHSVVTQPVWGEYLSTSEELTFHEEDGQYVEPSFLDIFTVEFIEGGPENALSEPYSIILTESLRTKYFGGEPALGKFIKAKNRYELKVTGVIKDLPEGSSFVMDYLSPIELIEINGTFSPLEEQWDNFSYYTYLLLTEHADAESFGKKISTFFKESEHFKDIPTKYTAWLNPITSVHLLEDPNEKGLMIIVYLYGSVAIFALLIACINFMNMTTAYSVARAKEIGIKKVVGSSRFALSKQFLFESVFVALVSMHIALILAEFALPMFNTIVSRQLDLSYVGNWPFTLFILGVSVLTGVISGAYPALYLSRFQPSKALKSASSLSNTKSTLRKSLVTFQFTISSILIICTIGIYNQFSFMKNKELGFDKELVMYTYVGAEERKDSRKLDIIKTRIEQIPEIQTVSVSQNIPFHSNSGSSVSWEGALPDQTINTRYNFVGYDYLDTYGLEVVEGRNFSRDFPSDSTEACLINETAVKVFGWDEPLDKKINFWGKDYRVVGVVRDFHPYSVFQAIPPVFFRLHDENIDQGLQHSVKIASSVNVLEAREKITAIYKEIFPNTLFDFKYYGNEMDDTVAVVYNGIVKTFLFFSLVILCFINRGRGLRRFCPNL